MSNKHKEIADAFAELNSTLDEKKDEYLEKISKVINKAVKRHNDKGLWKNSQDKIVDLVYAALTDTYLETTMALKNIYKEISDEIPNIEDFIYKDDNITLPKRIKQYWDEVNVLLKNPEADTQEISLYLLTMYNRILSNEITNVKQGLKKIKKPLGDEIMCVVITQGECENCPGQEGFFLEEDIPYDDLPPYHVNCTCDFWFDPYDPDDEQDLEELQEAGWEEDDG